MMRLRLPNAAAGLHQKELVGADLVRRRCLRRTLQIGSKALAAVNVPSLGVLVELARHHVLDHAQTQFTDGLDTDDFVPVLDAVAETSIQTTGTISLLSLCFQIVTSTTGPGTRSGYRASD